MDRDSRRPPLRTQAKPILQHRPDPSVPTSFALDAAIREFQPSPDLRNAVALAVRLGGAPNRLDRGEAFGALVSRLLRHVGVDDGRPIVIPTLLGWAVDRRAVTALAAEFGATVVLDGAHAPSHR